MRQKEVSEQYWWAFLQMQGLLQQECYDSAEILGSLMMCRSKAVAADLPASGKSVKNRIALNSPFVPPSRSMLFLVSGLGSHADSLVLYADALYGKGEYRRALVRPR